MSRPRLAITVCTIATIVTLSACRSDEPAATESAAAAKVTIATFIYEPKRLEVAAGTKVVWTNTDEILHTVTSGTRESATDDFDGQLDGKGVEFDHTFDEPGTYAYHCTRHPGMDAQVVVS